MFCLDVNQGGTTRNHAFTHICNFATDILINSDVTPKPGQSGLLYWPKSLKTKPKVGIFSSQLSCTANGLLVLVLSRAVDFSVSLSVVYMYDVGRMVLYVLDFATIQYYITSV